MTPQAIQYLSALVNARVLVGATREEARQHFQSLGLPREQVDFAVVLFDANDFSEGRSESDG